MGSLSILGDAIVFGITLGVMNEIAKEVKNKDDEKGLGLF
jgi:hypothetical protein